MPHQAGDRTPSGKPTLAERTLDAHVMLVAFMNRGGMYPTWIDVPERTPLARSIARCIDRGWLTPINRAVTPDGVEFLTELRGQQPDHGTVKRTL